MTTVKPDSRKEAEREERITRIRLYSRGACNFQKAITDWQADAFGTQPAIGALNHLRKEFDTEFWPLATQKCGSNEPPSDEERAEAADLVFLLMDYARRRGFDLMQAVAEKALVNFAREWKAPNADGVIEHKKEGESTND